MKRLYLIPRLSILKYQPKSRLIERIVAIPWNIYFQSIKRKQINSVSAYKVSCVNASLEDLHVEMSDKMIKTHNFKNMRPVDSGNDAFLDLLNIIEREVSSVTKFLIACCSIKIVSKKSREKKPYIDIFSKKDIEWLLQLKDKIGLERRSF